LRRESLCYYEPFFNLRVTTQTNPISMKRISFFILAIIVLIPSFSQSSARWVTRKYIIDKDSIVVEHKAVFTRFKYHDQKEEQDAVQFTLTIKNNSSHLIPDIQTARYRQTGGLKIYINGYDAMQMSLSNGLFGDPISLKKGESDSWPLEEQIAGPNAVQYGDVFTFQWKYMGIESAIIQVDIKNRTIKIVSEHIKSDKVIY